MSASKDLSDSSTDDIKNDGSESQAGGSSRVPLFQRLKFPNREAEHGERERLDVKEITKSRYRWVRNEPSGSNYPVNPALVRLPSTSPDDNYVFKISVAGGSHAVDPKWLIENLKTNVADFFPMLLSKNGKTAEIDFYIREPDVAEAVEQFSNRLENKEKSFRVVFKKAKIPIPWKHLEENELELIENELNNRFDESENKLNLACFDQEFESRDMKLRMTSGDVIMGMMKIIQEKYPNVTNIDLSENKLRFLDYPSALVHSLKSVKVLDLSCNLISNETELEKLYALDIEVLNLEGNPICDEFKTTSEYLSMVHRTFPRCKNLDGKTVRPLTFDFDNINGIPFRNGFYPNAASRDLVKKFLDEFYSLIDGENGSETRKQLINAYHETDSCFTLSTFDIKETGFQGCKSLSDCLGEKKEKKKSDKCHKYRTTKCVAKGSANIVDALLEFPVTKHLMETLISDVFLFTESCLRFTVQGIYSDAVKNVEDGEIVEYMFFCRTFVIAIKSQEKVTILSDQLLISETSEERVLQYKEMLKEAEKNVEAQETDRQPLRHTKKEAQAVPTLEEKAKLIRDFMNFSGQTETSSEMYLLGCDWDFEEACNNYEIEENAVAEANLQME